MKKKLLLFLSLFISGIIFSQQQKVWVPYRAGNQWGYSDTLGNITVKPAYDSVDFFEGNFGFVYKGDNTGVVNKAGVEIIKPGYSRIETFEDGYRVYKDNKSGYISGQGKLLMPVIYDDFYSVDQYIIIQQGKKYGIADKDGIGVVPVEYDDIRIDFLSSKLETENYFVLDKEGDLFSFHKKTRKLAKLKSGDVEEMKDAMLGTVNVEGDFAIENTIELYRKEVQKKLQADEVVRFEVMGMYASQIYFLVTIKGKKGVVEYISDTEIKTIVPAEYDAVSYVITNAWGSFVNPGIASLAAVSKNGKFGIVNEKGGTVIPFEYSMIGPLAGFASAFELQKENKKGVYLPTTYYPVIPPKYDAIEYATSMSVNANWSFVLYKVKLQGKDGYVGENGKEYFK